MFEARYVITFAFEGENNQRTFHDSSSRNVWPSKTKDGARADALEELTNVIFTLAQGKLIKYVHHYYVEVREQGKSWTPGGWELGDAY